jgi:hypothetical protein
MRMLRHITMKIVMAWTMMSKNIICTHSISHSMRNSGNLVCSRSQYPDLAVIAPFPVASPLLEFSAPAFQELSEKRSRRALVDHSCNTLSRLVAFKEDTGNPFQQLVPPLSRKLACYEFYFRLIKRTSGIQGRCK